MLRLICIGDVASKNIKSLIADYCKKISFYSKFEIIELKELAKLDTPSKIKKESMLIMDSLKQGYNILFDIEGKKLSSPEIAEQINKCISNSLNVNFIIGGSNGVSNELKDKVDLRLSFGNVTFPHQLFRLMASEQIYRALSIINNSQYHK